MRSATGNTPPAKAHTESPPSGVKIAKQGVVKASSDSSGGKPPSSGKKTAKQRKQTVPRPSQEPWQALFEESSLPTCFYAPESYRIVLANRAFLQFYGYNAEELPNLTIASLHIDNDGRSPWNGLSEGAAQGVIWHQRKDGGHVSVEIHTSALVHEGKPVRLAQIHDKTEKRELEARFLRAQRMECLGMLACGVAHDLNNILAPILMAASMLQEELPHEAQQEFVSAIEQSAQRGAKLLRQILAFVRGVEGEKTVMQPEMLINEVLEMARQTFPKSVAIAPSISPGLWEISGEATQLYQVFLNLAVNARDAMDGQGTLGIEVHNSELDAASLPADCDVRPGRYVGFHVRDSGSGMSEEVLSQIFVPFYSTKAIEHGTGLGLPTVLGIIRAHRGMIDVKSEPGQGSVFSVYLPAIEQVEVVGAGAQELPLDEGKGKTILVIDGDAATQAMVKTVLERQGYRVLCGGNGTEGVSAYVTKLSLVDLVIADLMMPSMDGVVFARAIKRLNRNARFIISSDIHSPERLHELKGMGITHVLQKPYDAGQLVAAVQIALSQEAPFGGGLYI